MSQQGVGRWGAWRWEVTDFALFFLKKNYFRRLVAFRYKINVSLYVEKRIFLKKAHLQVWLRLLHRHLQITVQPTCCCRKFESFCFAFIESDDSRVKRRLFLLRMPVFMCNTNQLHITSEQTTASVSQWLHGVPSPSC